MLCRVLRWLGLHKPPPMSGEAKAPLPKPLVAMPAEAARSRVEPQELPRLPAAARHAQPRVVATAPTEVRQIEIVIGIDFGTSCTKIAARFPYEAGQPTYALPVPPERQAESHLYLWCSELWLAADDVFSLHAVTGGKHLTHLKWDLMQSPDLSATPGPQPSPVEAAAAFLALQIRRVRHWVAQKHPARLDENLLWSWHVGFPSASLDDAARRLRYEICLAAAIELAAGSEPLRLARVRDATLRACGAAAEYLQEAGAALVPEIAAAVADFAQSPRHENGLYAMIDVGAGTFDCCAFNLAHLRNGTTACPIFAADVALLGVEPWRACNRAPAAEAEFRDRLDRCVWPVIWVTKMRGYPSSSRWAEGLPLFLIGGGKESKPHRECAESLTPWIRRHLGADEYPNPYPRAGVPIVALPSPALLDYEGTDPQSRRLTVAAGLSLPADSIPGVELPGTIPDADRPPGRDISDVLVEKEQT